MGQKRCIYFTQDGKRYCLNQDAVIPNEAKVEVIRPEVWVFNPKAETIDALYTRLPELTVKFCMAHQRINKQERCSGNPNRRERVG